MKSKQSYASNLAYLLKGICHVPSALDTSVSGLRVDSRLVQKGDLFLALSGCRSKSTDHIVEAIERGANAIVAEGGLFDGRVFEDGTAVELFVDDLKHKAGTIADRFFCSPSHDMCVIGVTGTNGKTSVASYLADYFSLGGVKSGLIGTLGYGLVGLEDSRFTPTDHTTPNVVEVHRFLATLRDCGAEVVVMEVSSHGLSQGRVDGVAFDGAVFTNLTRDHLDYHGTMAAYGECKRTLFKTPQLKFAVINNDDIYAAEIKSVINSEVNVVTYGIDVPADIYATKSKYNTKSISSTVVTSKQELSIKSTLLGRFNLSNLLAVIAVASAKNDLSRCQDRVKNISAVKGRMEVLRENGKPLVVIDYAHTPDALKSVLVALKSHCEGRIFLVFGCGGDRDQGKRPEMAEVAEAFANEIWVTNDNPRNEDPVAITNDILAGFSASDSINVEHDRKKAIECALSLSNENDLVLIAGKGHETWQEINGKRHFFSDIEEVRRHFDLCPPLTPSEEVVHD